MARSDCRAKPVEGRTPVTLKGGKQQAECENCGGVLWRSLYVSNAKWAHVASQQERRAKAAALRGSPEPLRGISERLEDAGRC